MFVPPPMTMKSSGRGLTPPGLRPLAPKLINTFPLNLPDSPIANGITITPISNGKPSKQFIFNTVPSSVAEPELEPVGAGTFLVGAGAGVKM